MSEAIPPASGRSGARGQLPGWRIALPTRYDRADLQVLDAEERWRFGEGDPGEDIDLCWELFYRLEPELYDRLIRAESLHPGILAWLPSHPRHVLEVAAGTGRLSIPMAQRCSRLIAVEPAARCAQSFQHDLRPLDAGTRVRSGDSSTGFRCRMVGPI